MKPGLNQLDREAWDGEASGFLDANYRQTWAFGVRAAKHIGAVTEHVALAPDGKVIALADVRLKVLPVIGGGVAYVNGGPLVRRRGVEPAAAEGALIAMLGALRDEYVRRRGMVLRIVGTLADDPWNAAQERAFRQSGFGPGTAGMTYRTFMVELKGTAESMRAGLAQKWRNCLNKAEKQGVSVTEHDDVESMRRFAALYEQFVQRKGISTNHDAAFFLDVQADARNGERLTVRLAQRDGEVLAGHASSTAAGGDTCVYLLGATAPAGLACNAAYLLQWSTMVRSLERGVRWYDLGGIDPEGNPGVYHFKKGMNGVDVTAPGPWELRPGGLRGRVTLSSERLYRTWRERRKKHAAGPDERSTEGTKETVK